MGECLANDLAASSPLVYHAITVKYLDIVATILTIIGNGVCILTFIKTRSLHSPANFLVGALCMSDFIVGLVVQPFYLAMLITMQTSSVSFEGYWQRTDFVMVLFNGFSVFLAYLVTLDRYLAICYPLRYYTMVTIKRYVLMVFVASLTALIGALAVLYDRAAYYYGSAMIYIIFAQFVVFYGLIYNAIRQQRNRITVLGSIDGESRSVVRKQKAEKDKAYTIGILLVIFFLCNFPGTVIFMIAKGTNELCNWTAVEIKMHMWSFWLFLLNSSINPIIYSLRSKEFRRATKRLVCRGFLARLSDSDSGIALEVPGRRLNTESL
ncbi:trace amine-associated receptor 13c-like [Rhopilema esculentum]|uniref:trace amine-associated receptor 13c-like n=1 Tax=Rhopilema esculentum TaxID=499914 RepID=UPI0031DD5B16|eukprot:gene4782-21091_t